MVNCCRNVNVFKPSKRHVESDMIIEEQIDKKSNLQIGLCEWLHQTLPSNLPALQRNIRHNQKRPILPPGRAPTIIKHIEKHVCKIDLKN